MGILDRRKSKERRSSRDRRKSNTVNYRRLEKRGGMDRRRGKNRRNGADDGEGLYGNLTEDKRKAVDHILRVLEHQVNYAKPKR